MPDSDSPTPRAIIRGTCETCDGPLAGLAVGEDSALGRCVRCGTVVVVHADGGREVYRPLLVDRVRALGKSMLLQAIGGDVAAEWDRLNVSECLYRPAFRRSARGA